MILEVLYSCNEFYIEQALVSICSLCENNRTEFKEIRIHFVEDGLSIYSKQLLKQLVKNYFAQLFLYPLEEVIDKNLLNSHSARHPLSIYSKIFCGKLPIEHKLLYLDCDCIIVNSLKKLWNMDMKEKVIAGVKMPYSLKYKKYNMLGECLEYICDGVVLFNLSLWRNGKYEEKCINYISSFSGSPPMLSEGTLNSVCKDVVMILEPRYNMMGHLFLMTSSKICKLYKVNYYMEELRKSALLYPVVIHYIREFFERPWFRNSDHPQKKYYKFYSEIVEAVLKIQIQEKKGDFPIKSKFIRYILSIVPEKVIEYIGDYREKKYK